MKERWRRPLAVHAYRLLWSCHGRMARMLERHLRGYGTTLAQYGVLRCVPQDGGATASELAQEILRGKSNLTTLIARMEKGGLIRTQLDPEDGRRRRVTLTPRGRDAQEQLVPPVYEFIDGLFSCFAKEEAEQLVALLRRLNEHLDKGHSVIPAQAGIQGGAGGPGLSGQARQ